MSKMQIVMSGERVRRAAIGVVAAAPLLLSGCGGGGGGGGSSAAAASATGHFIDAATQGLHYSSASYSGVTGAGGSFTYKPGETVTFSVGNVVLGSAQGGSVVTPMSLVGGSSTTTPKVQNIVRLLMMLDSDGNPSNGITISSTVATAAQGWSLDPSLDTTSFGNELTGIKSEVQSDYPGITVTVPNPTDASNHLDASYACAYTGVSTGTYSGDYSGRWAYIASPSGAIVGAAVDSTSGYALGAGSLTAGPSATTSLGITTTGDHFSGTVGEDGAVSGTWSGTGVSGTFSGGPLDLGVEDPSGGKLYSLVYTASGTELGLMRIAVDSGGGVTGKLFSGAAWITDPQADIYTVSGTLSGSTLALTTSDGGTFNATVASDGTISGNWSNSSYGSGSVNGCQAEF